MRRNVSPLQRPDGVHRGYVDVAAGVPPAELLPTTALRVKPRLHRQAANQRKEIQGCQAPVVAEQIPQIHPVILSEVAGQELTVLIYEFGESSEFPD
jgi:hypothetical protein